MSQNGRQAPKHPNAAGDDGGALFVMGYDEHDALGSIAQQLTRQVEPTPEVGGDEGRDGEAGGVLRRTNEFRSQLGPVMLESVGLAGMEIAKAVERRARDLYRNKFPLLTPAFAKACRECELTFDNEDLESCPDCGSDLETPDESQRAWAQSFFDEVNKEGQSLAELYQALARDAGRLGGWTHVVRYNYACLNGAIMREVSELVRADPKRLKPVVDEDLRIGGYWWACPIHREPLRAEERDEVGGECPECGAELREVYFAETDTIDYRGRANDGDPEKVYFRDEVIDFAAFNERLAGHDWLSPVEHLWKRQAILEWMNTYAGAFFDDQNTERYPGRILMLHTSNRDLVEKQLSEASDEREQDPYKNGVLYNELPRDGGGGSDNAQVLDMASDEIIGQSPDLKDDFKSDIRTVYGQVDVQDSELEDAGGLNNEGLQLTVRDGAIASWQAELRDGPLAKLTRVLGLTDWEVRFVPPEAPEEDATPEEVVNAVATAEQAGIPYEIADGQFMLADTDGIVEPEGQTPAPGEDGGGFGADDDGGGGGGGSPFSQSRSRPDPTQETREIDLGLDEDVVSRAVSGADTAQAREACDWLGDAHDALWAPADDETDTVEQQGDPMTNGHDMDPGTGRVTCATADDSFVIEDATFDDLAEDCPLCGDPLSLVDADEQAHAHDDLGHLTQEAGPVVDSDEDVPEFAQELLDDAVEGGAITKPQDLSDRQFRTLETVVRDSLTQPSGWSIDSIDRRFAPTVPDLDVNKRRRYVQNAVQQTVNAALALGYVMGGDLDDREFYLGGPVFSDTCDTCEAVLERTNPAHEGNPVPIDEFRDIAENAAEQHGIDPEMITAGTLHPSCRHRLTEHRDARS